MKRFVSRFLSGAIITVALVIGFGQLTAHPVSALTFVPPSFDWTLAPGQSRQDVIKLYNDTAAPLTMYTVTAPFSAKDETGTPAFDLNAKSKDLPSWVTISAGPFTIAPNDKVEIPFQVSVPANAEPGGHYAGIFFGGPTDTATGGNQVSIRALSGPLMILRVSGKVREAAAIKEFGVDGGSTLTRLPATFFARIQNSGNVHVRPTGTITITNMFGGDTAELKLNENNGAVLPESTRRFEATWAKASDAAKRGNFFSEVGAEWQNFAIGTYNVKLDLTYGSSPKSLSASTSVLIIPWQLLLVELVGLVLIVLILIFGMKRYNSAIIKRAQSRPFTPPGRTR